MTPSPAVRSINPTYGYHARLTDEAERAKRHSAHFFVQTADIETTSPEPRTYVQKADSGNEMTRAWCDGCGAGIWLRSASKPGLTFLKAGESGESTSGACWILGSQSRALVNRFAGLMGEVPYGSICDLRLRFYGSSLRL